MAFYWSTAVPPPSTPETERENPMNTVRVRANSNRPADSGAWVELFAQDDGGVWVRVSVSGRTGRPRSTSVIVGPAGAALLHDWLDAYRKPVAERSVIDELRELARALTPESGEESTDYASGVRAAMGVLRARADEIEQKPDHQSL